MSFYLTLPSNASTEHFPDNKTNKYTTNLARCIDLDGAWEVALVEAVFPPLKIVASEDLTISYFGPSGTNVRYNKWIAKGDVFGSTLDLINHINSISHPHVDEQKQKKQGWELTLQDGKQYLNVRDGAKIKFHGRELAMLLGVELAREYKGIGTPLPLQLRAELDYVYLYCDVIEHIPIGDVMAPCLRVLPINRQSSSYTVIRFDNAHYVPLLRNAFSRITLDFVSDLGDDIRFQFGMTLVKLHFRPRKL